MPSPRLIPALLALCLLATALPARADDRAKAAEHFALAESAERRKDWAAAIREYTAANELAPHPSVTYNIALNYERLGDNKEAALAFLRYLDQSGEADDRDEVLARVKGLREASSTVRIDAAQTEVHVWVDGVDRGIAPLSLDLPGGQHVVLGTLGETTGPEHTLLLEYGAPASLTLDVSLRPGVLSVLGKRRGVEIWMGDTLLGHTPFHGKVPAGEHTLVLKAPGFLTQERKVSIPSQGSRQVRVAMKPDPTVKGSKGNDEDASKKPVRKNGFFIGLGYGLQGSEYRGAVEFGGSLLKSRLDLALIYGAYGSAVGAGFGGQARFFLTDNFARVYSRGAFIIGSDADDDSTMAIEAGVGMAIGTRPRPNRPRPTLRYEYYLEASMQLQPGTTGDDASEPGGTSLSFPLMLGVVFRGG